MVLSNYLPEPGALKNNEAGTEEFQHDVVPEDHFQGEADSPCEHGAQQEGVDVLVQRWPVVDVVVQEEACVGQEMLSGPPPPAPPHPRPPPQGIRSQLQPD